jgi:membrane fusion protein, multidrug efflux system
MFSKVKSWWARNQPDFWRAMKPRYRAALSILIVAAVWLGLGVLWHGGSGAAVPDPAKTTADAIPRVRVETLIATERSASITVHGRTQALHKVEIRAEVDGVVEALHFEKGDAVKAGDVLCELKINDREAKLAEAKALVTQRAMEYNVDAKLAKLGASTRMQVTAAAAALEAARASANSMEIQLANTKIKAPFDGIADDRFVEVGDYMRAGDHCALIMAPEPFLIAGQVSEHDVGEIVTGEPASAKLITGESVQGHIRFVGKRAEATTRTFTVEVEVPNPTGALRDGITAEIAIPVKRLKAQKISPGIMVLDDTGVVGVRIVQNGKARFVAVQPIGEDADGMWVTGLPDKVTVITVGQQFVSNGQKVAPISDAGIKS